MVRTKKFHDFASDVSEHEFSSKQNTNLAPFSTLYARGWGGRGVHMYEVNFAPN